MNIRFSGAFFFQFAGFQIFSAFPAPDFYSLCYRYVMYVLYGLRQVPIPTKAPTPNFEQLCEFVGVFHVATNHPPMTVFL